MRFLCPLLLLILPGCGLTHGWAKVHVTRRVEPVMFCKFEREQAEDPNWEAYCFTLDEVKQAKRAPEADDGV
jgi:hypothetical protein